MLVLAFLCSLVLVDRVPGKWVSLGEVTAVQDRGPETARAVFEDVERAVKALPNPSSPAAKAKRAAAIAELVKQALGEHSGLFEAEDGKPWRVRILALAEPRESETFDIISYEPPKGWKKQTDQGVVNYTHVDATTGGFCVIAIHASTESVGDPKADFARDWEAMVVKPFQPKTKPWTKDRARADGWQVVTGTSPLKVDGVDMKVMLAVLSGGGKSMSVRASFNQEGYAAQCEALVQSFAFAVPAVTVQGNLQKFGALTYTVPAGWSHQRFQDGIVFKPLDLPKGEHLAIQIMPPIMGVETLEEALAKTYDEAVTMYHATKMNEVSGGHYSKEEARKSFKGWEYLRCSGGIQTENGTPYKSEFGLELFVVKVRTRFERVVVLKSRTNCSYSRYYPSDRVSYRNAIETFLFGLNFEDWKESALPLGSTKGAGIIGVWQGISLATSARAGLRYDVFSAMFLSNGQAYFGTRFPSVGLDGFNARVAAENNRRDWGTYTFSNGKGMLKLPYAEIPLRSEDDKLVITSNRTDHKFFQLKSVDGARFDGKYVLGEQNGVVPAITFEPDGRFDDKGALKILCHEYLDCLNPGLLPGSGTYEVKDHTVTFRYSDGRRVALAFLGIDFDLEDRRPATLGLSSNEDRLRRQ